MSATNATMDDLFINKDVSTKRREELVNFTKIIKGNPERLNALCGIQVIDGSALDECCKSVGMDKLKTIMRDAVALLISGKMVVNGKENNWSNGCFGSRWFDMNAEKYGVDYIRGAFYTKKESGSEWKHAKSYHIQIIVELAK
jgi:hypothetical protein